MADITGWQTVTVLQNNTGQELTIPNIVRDDIIVAISDVGGSITKPDLRISGGDVETLADLVTSPEYEKVTTHTTEETVCRRYWHPYWPYYTYYWWYHPYYRNWWWWRWGYMPLCTTRVRTYTSTELELALTSVTVMRSKSDGPFTMFASSTIPQSTVDRFTIYHIRPTVSAASGYTVQKLTWIPRAQRATEKTSENSTHIFTLAKDNLVFALGAGNEGGTTAISPSGGVATNLINQEFAFGTKIRTRFRMDFVTADGSFEIAYSKLNVARYLQAFAAQFHQSLGTFPTTGGVYWLVSPARAHSDLTFTYPSEVQALLVHAENIDPVSTGLEFRWPGGNVQFIEDESGTVSIDSWDEIHLLRFPDTIQVSLGIGEILTSDADVESWIKAQEKGW